MKYRKNKKQKIRIKNDKKMHALLRRSSGQDPEQTRQLADFGWLAALQCAWLALACERHADKLGSWDTGLETIWVWI